MNITDTLPPSSAKGQRWRWRWLSWCRRHRPSTSAEQERYPPTSRIERRISQHLRLNQTQQQNLQQFLAGLEALWLEWQQRRLLDRAELLALLATPRLDREKAMSIVKHRTRLIDERSAELIMAFAEFSDSLDKQQKHALLDTAERWLSGQRPFKRGVLRRLFSRRSRWRRSRRRC